MRSIFAEWERGDMRRTDWADHDIEYVNADGPSPGSWSGLEGMAHAVRDWLSAWQDWSAEAEDYRELDDERVLVLVKYGGSGRSSGVGVAKMQATGAHLFCIRDGKVKKQIVYWDRERALADLDAAPEGRSSNAGRLR